MHSAKYSYSGVVWSLKLRMSGNSAKDSSLLNFYQILEAPFFSEDLGETLARIGV